MRRTKSTMESPDYILSSDWHLRDSQPICRTDDFEEAQWKAVDFVSELQKKYDCPVLHAGDLYHHWKPSPYLLAKTIQHLPQQFYSIYGNHDLPQHAIELLNKCGIYVLQQAGILKTNFPSKEVELCHFHQTPKQDFADILVWHIMTYQGKEPWPGCTDPKAAKLLMKNPSYKLILTGDNHMSFVEEYEGRHLVNPGSLTRQTAKQIDFKPSVYLYFEKSNTIERVFIPILKGVISREHIEEEESRDARIEAFISTLSTDWKIGFDFKENLKNFAKKNEVKKSTMELILNAIES